MIELEVQILALDREELLMDIGRVVAASGFALQRQRLAEDRHGALLTLLVRGTARARRTLDAALGKHPRVVSFVIEPAEGDTMRPHFAAARQSEYVPPPAPAPAPSRGKHALSGPPMPPPPRVHDAEALAFFDRAPERTTWTESIELLPRLGMDADPPWEAWPAPMMETPPEAEPPPATPARTVPPAPSPVAGGAASTRTERADAPSLDVDTVAVERLMRALPGAYPSVLPLVKAMDRTVVPSARDASLASAGVRVGRWIAARQGAAGVPLPPGDALATRGMPALRELLDARMHGGQVHLGASPLCGTPGHSGCTFFAGVLRGAVEPLAGDGPAQVIGLCCRALGADECVLTMAD